MSTYRGASGNHELVIGELLTLVSGDSFAFDVHASSSGPSEILNTCSMPICPHQRKTGQQAMTAAKLQGLVWKHGTSQTFLLVPSWLLLLASTTHACMESRQLGACTLTNLAQDCQTGLAQTFAGARVTFWLAVGL